jgi:hypothetical protein
MMHRAGSKNILPQSLVWVELAITLTILGHLIFPPASGPMAWPSDDFAQYWAAGRLNARGLNPYSPELLLSLQSKPDCQKKHKRKRGCEPTSHS